MIIIFAYSNNINAQNKSFILWNNSKDSVIINDKKTIVIGINGKTCNDCLKGLINSIEQLNKDVKICITLQSSQNILVKKSMRNSFDRLFEDKKYNFFIHNNISDSLLNADNHTPTIFLFNEQSFSSFNIEDYYDYAHAKIKDSFLKKSFEN